MNTYDVKIDGGHGGRTSLKADDIVDAMNKAEEFAKAGDWSNAKHPARTPDDWVLVSVENVDGSSDEDWTHFDPFLWNKGKTNEKI